MSYEIVAIPNFRKQIKKLSKKFPSLKTDFSGFLEQLHTEPAQGTALGNNCYKIRMAITSKGKGKSGGARIITHIKISKSIVYLLSIYDKSDRESITNQQLAELLQQIPE